MRCTLLIDAGIILALVAAVIAYLLVLEWFMPYFFLSVDNPIYFLPAYVYNWRAVVEETTIPLLNWHQLLGQTYLGQAQSGVLYLPAYGAVWLSRLVWGHEYATIDILAFMHLALAPVGMYLLLRQLGLERGVSFLGGLLWVTSPYLLGSAKDTINYAYLSTYLPFCFLLLERLMVKPTFWRALALALLTSMFFFQGYVQHVVLLLEFELWYLLLWFGRRQIRRSMAWKRSIVLWGLSLIMFLFIVAPLLLPLWYTQRVSFERAQPFTLNEFASHSLDPSVFSNVQVFNFLPPDGFHPGSYFLYFGPFSLALLFFPFIRPLRDQLRARKISTFLILSLTGLLLSTVLYSVFYLVPGLDRFRIPIKYYIFFIFFGTLVIAGVADDLVKGHRAMGKGAIFSLLALLIFLNVAVVWSHRGGLFRTQGFDFRLETPPYVPLMQYVGQDGRIFSYDFSIEQASLKPQRSFMFNYATLFGLYHFSGYDPLQSQLNYHLTLGWASGYLASHQYPFTEKLLDYLSAWSVTHLVTEDTPKHRELFARYPQLTLQYAGEELLLYKNTVARPFVYTAGDPDHALPYRFGINHLDVFLDGTPQQLVITVAPLPTLHYDIDGVYQGRIDQTETRPVTLFVPEGSHHLRLYHWDRPFWVGVGLFGGFWLVVAVFAGYCLPWRRFILLP